MFIIDLFIIAIVGLILILRVGELLGKFMIELYKWNNKQLAYCEKFYYKGEMFDITFS